MTPSCCHFKMSTVAVNKVRMHIIIVSVTVSLIKIQLLMILKKGLLQN